MPAKDYSPALLTDLYELTMAQVYWRNDMRENATFSLFFRGYPHDRAYYAFAGLESVLEFLESFRFSSDDIEYLRSTEIFDPRFLGYLSNLRFSGHVRAMPEGTLAFADEPVIEVTAPVIEAQVIETFLLNQVTFQTTLLTKATRIVQAAAGRDVIDFGARRTHGTESADMAARCAAIGGFAGTSDMRAAARFGITPVGTMAHSFIQAYGDELAAFRAYASEFPASTTLLVDTYDTLSGVRNAVTVAKEMAKRGHQLRAIRLDSGDLAELAFGARSILDDAGLDYVKVTASSDLDEHRIAGFVERCAPIDSFGVGTRFGVSIDAPVANSAYKLVQYGDAYSAKLSPGKATLPGPKQVYRVSVGDRLTGDVIATRDEPAPGRGEPLLETVMVNGERAAPAESWQTARDRLAGWLEATPQRHRLLTSPSHYPVSVSDALSELLREEEERRSR